MLPVNALSFLQFILILLVFAFVICVIVQLKQTKARNNFFPVHVPLPDVVDQSAGPIVGAGAQVGVDGNYQVIFTASFANAEALDIRVRLVSDPPLPDSGYNVQPESLRAGMFYSNVTVHGIYYLVRNQLIYAAVDSAVDSVVGATFDCALLPIF